MASRQVCLASTDRRGSMNSIEFVADVAPMVLNQAEGHATVRVYREPEARAGSRPLFAIPSGTHVTLLASYGKFYLVQVMDGQRGWVGCKNGTRLTASSPQVSPAQTHHPTTPTELATGAFRPGQLSQTAQHGSVEEVVPPTDSTSTIGSLPQPDVVLEVPTIIVTPPPDEIDVNAVVALMAASEELPPTDSTSVPISTIGSLPGSLPQLAVISDAAPNDFAAIMAMSASRGTPLAQVQALNPDPNPRGAAAFGCRSLSPAARTTSSLLLSSTPSGSPVASARTAEESMHDAQTLVAEIFTPKSKQKRANSRSQSCKLNRMTAELRALSAENEALRRELAKLQNQRGGSVTPQRRQKIEVSTTASPASSSTGMLTPLNGSMPRFPAASHMERSSELGGA